MVQWLEEEEAEAEEEGWYEAEYLAEEGEAEYLAEEGEAGHGLAFGFGFWGVGVAVISASRPHALQTGVREVERRGYRLIYRIPVMGRYMVAIVRQVM